MAFSPPPSTRYFGLLQRRRLLICLIFGCVATWCLLAPSGRTIPFRSAQWRTDSKHKLQDWQAPIAGISNTKSPSKESLGPDLSTEVKDIDEEVNHERHVIDDLMLQAEFAQHGVLKKQTHSIEAAAKAYRKHRGRHPPPKFDEWHKWATDHNVLLIEDFWDPLYEGLEPFWNVPAAFIRDFPRSWSEIISIRNGEVSRFEDEPGNIANWMDIYADGLKLLPLADLPDIDLAFNAHDEAKLFTPWHVKAENLKQASITKLANPPTATPSVTGFESRPSFPKTRPPPPERTHFAWENYPQEWSLWIAARGACSPDSPAWREDAEPAGDFSTPFEWPTQSLESMVEGYVANWTNAKSACENPHLREIHGTFIAMQSECDVPGIKAVIATMVPLLGGSKLHDITNEILIPPAMQWPSASNVDQSFNAKDEGNGSWDEKLDQVMWRGVASGGVNNKDNWTRFPRHRFLAMLNGSLVAQHQGVADEPIPDRLPGGTPFLPHNFPMPNNKLYRLGAMETDDPASSLKDWISNKTNAGFTHLRCWPIISWFGTNGKECEYDDMFYAAVEHQSGSEQFKSKFLPDIDGASYSGRYRSFLFSDSVPIKATVYDEWHDSRIVPWKHFVPMDNTFMDWWAILQYFMGFGDTYPKHDEEAKKIAFAGKQWANTVLRTDDMLAYMYRLILEMARLQDERRVEMGWAGDMA